MQTKKNPYSKSLLHLKRTLGTHQSLPTSQLPGWLWTQQDDVCMSFEDALENRVMKCYKYSEVRGTRGHRYRQYRGQGPRIPHKHYAHAPKCFLGCLLVRSWLITSRNLNRKLLQTLNYIGSVVQSYITLTPRDPGLTHIASWCLAFSMSILSLL